LAVTRSRCIDVAAQRWCTLAEVIEDLDDWEFLAHLACDVGQA
jgi:hypothetical protein